MHEIPFVRKLISELEKEAADPGVGEVRTVHLEIGESHNLTSEAINDCFSHMEKNEKLRNARIDAAIVPGNAFTIKGIEW